MKQADPKRSGPVPRDRQEMWRTLQRQHEENRNLTREYREWAKEEMDRSFRVNTEILNELRRIKALLSDGRS